MSVMLKFVVESRTASKTAHGIYTRVEVGCSFCYHGWNFCCSLRSSQNNSETV